jgi:mortality factor 4-like protein 1
MSSNTESPSFSAMHVEEEKPLIEEGDDSSSDVIPPPYLPDQRVVCMDPSNDEQYYEAVVRKVRLETQGKWTFFIHYLGWNSRWDRWAENEDLKLDTPENRKLCIKEPMKEQPSRKRKKETEASSSSTGTTGNTAGRKRKPEAAMSLSHYHDYCELPFTLKTILVEECEHITRKGFDSPLGFDCEVVPKFARSVHQLPAPVTVKQILQHYQRKRGGADANEDKKQQVRRFCDGIEKLFEDALPVCLLYPQERPQYEAILQNDILKKQLLSEIYGCQFLLRLMVRLPILLQAEHKREMTLFGPLLSDLIVLLQKNRQACFKGTYREPKAIELMEWEASLAAEARSAMES